ncbi:MAG: hypothetical protein ISR96_03060 [Nitrospira sp.]|nr:hypothetical protein [bacterium]MBL7048494.1 hypothetical protein [Nitrospira sp.]
MQTHDTENSRSRCPHLVEGIGDIILLCEKGKSTLNTASFELGSLCKSSCYAECKYYYSDDIYPKQQIKEQSKYFEQV